MPLTLAALPTRRMGGGSPTGQSALALVEENLGMLAPRLHPGAIFPNYNSKPNARAPIAVLASLSQPQTSFGREIGRSVPLNRGSQLPKCYLNEPYLEPSAPARASELRLSVTTLVYSDSSVASTMPSMSGFSAATRARIASPSTTPPTPSMRLKRSKYGGGSEEGRSGGGTTFSNETSLSRKIRRDRSYKSCSVAKTR